MNRSRQNARGSATAAFLLALVLTLLVAATVFAFAAHIFPAPAPITVAAVLVDQQYTRTLYVAGAVFVLAQLGLAFDRDGYLIARGDFDGPVGPDDWDRVL